MSTSKTSQRLGTLHKYVTRLARMNSLDDVYTYSVELLGGLNLGDVCIGVVERSHLLLFWFTRVSGSVDSLPLDGECIMVRAWRTGDTQFVEDTRSVPAYVGLGNGAVLSEMAVPVHFDGGTVAVIYLGGRRVDEYTVGDRQFIEILSGLISSTLYRIGRISEQGASESKYRTLVEHSNDSITVVCDSKITYVNLVTAKLCGYNKPEEMIGMDALGFIPGEYRDYFRDRIGRRIKGEPQPVRFDHEIVRRDGSIVQVETTASLINYGGKPGVLFVGRDLTERKKFESKLFDLHEYAAQLGAAETVADVSDATLGAITSVMGFGLADFLVMEGDCLRSINCVGHEETYWDAPIEGSGTLARAASERLTVMANDMGGGASSDAEQPNVKSELATPVIVDGEVEAVIRVESTMKGAFTEHDAQILEIIAQHVASAWERIGRGK